MFLTVLLLLLCLSTRRNLLCYKTLQHTQQSLKCIKERKREIQFGIASRRSWTFCFITICNSHSLKECLLRIGLAIKVFTKNLNWKIYFFLKKRSCAIAKGQKCEKNINGKNRTVKDDGHDFCVILYCLSFFSYLPYKFMCPNLKRIA